eukprot:scpid58251/ scgid4761/ Mitochondrial thiamine pyrophosphate carrier; Solute carrier family 25 member 19
MDGERRDKLLRSDYAVAGAVSGVVTRALVSPLDLLKIRYQLQVSSAAADIRYTGIVSSLVRVVKEEGVRGLWKGHVPAQLLSVTYGAVQFYAFEGMKTSASHFGQGSSQGSPASASRPSTTAATNFICGGLAGCCATLAAHPLDVMRTRLVAQCSRRIRVYTSLHQGVLHVWRNEGALAFYRGLSPTLLLVFPQTGLQFSIYHSLSSLWTQTLGERSVLGFPRSSVCGMAAGMLSKLAILPLDLMKKRLQVQGFEQAWSSVGQTRQYVGALDCARTVWLQEGILGFYKGTTPSLLKAGVSVALIFTSYEWCLDILCHLRGKES